MVDIPGLIFWLFSGLIVLSALAVVFSRNPVHAVLFLIFCFFNAAGLFILLGAEYIAMTLVIVYVGAVAILFLFVVMMLDVKYEELKQGLARYVPFGMAVAGLLIALIYTFLDTSLMLMPGAPQGTLPIPDPSVANNAEAIGQVLYTRFAYLFQLAGLILLVAMVAAIVLTLRTRPGVRRQRIAEQVTRGREGAKLMDVDVRGGV